MSNSNMVAFITITTLVHGALYFLDEHHFHKKRGLTEREANFLLFDGVLFLATVALTIFTNFGPLLSKVYIVLAFLSCFSIIKNEIFYDGISLNERFTHAGLYILHPLILYAFYTSWQMDLFNTNMTYWMLQLCYFILGFKAMSFHVIYWNYIAKKKSA